MVDGLSSEVVLSQMGVGLHQGGPLLGRWPVPQRSLFLVEYGYLHCSRKGLTKVQIGPNTFKLALNMIELTSTGLIGLRIGLNMLEFSLT